MKTETEVEQQEQPAGNPEVVQEPKVPFNPSLDKFTNIKTPEQLLKATEVLTDTLAVKLKYWVKDGKGNNQLVETSVWTDEEAQFIKRKLLTLLNHVQ